MDKRVKLLEVLNGLKGLAYTDRRAVAAFNSTDLDWLGYYPTADEFGILDGGLVSAELMAGMVVRDDLIAVPGFICCACDVAKSPRELALMSKHNTGGEMICLACHVETITNDPDAECDGCKEAS